MSTNKKFRIQNGVDVVGELTVNDVVIIRADGTIVAGAIADAVSSLVDEGALTGSGSSIVDSDSQIFIDVNSNTVAIASETATRISDIASLQTQIDSLGVNSDTQAEVDSLQTQIDSIVGASPETLDTLVEIVSAFEGADSDIQSLLAANSSSLSANTAAIGVETTQRIAGDVTLQQNIDAEVARASAAELANAAAIAAESATRGAAVSALQASQFTYNDSDGWTGNLIPSADNEYTLGSPDRVWKDLYIGPGSLYINGTKILEDNSGTITMYADAGQNLSFGATGGGNIDLNAGDESVQLKSDLVMSVGETISTVGGEPTKFGGAVDMGTHKVKNVGAPVDASDAATKEYVDSLNADGTITGDKVFEDNVTIEGNLTVEGTTTTLDSQTLKVADNIIDLNSNVSTGAPVLNAGIRIMRGDEPAVQLRWNELDDRWEVYDGVTATPIAVTSTDAIAEGDNKLFFTVVRAREAVSQDIADAVAAEATARGAAIDAEIARATSAEQANAAAIVAEASAREDAVTAEAAARVAGDATVQSAVDAEQASRIAADLSEAQTRAAAVSDLQNQLNTISNTDLSSLQSQLDAIVGTSPETLDTLQEVVAAFENADSDIQTLLSNNSSTLADLSNAIADEINDRNFAIAVEKQQREDADEALQSSIDAVSATVSSNNAAKSNAISAESAARIAGDSDLNDLISANATAEATARVAGDATVQAAVDAEAARATSAEQANASAISTETSRATAAETDLQNQINQVEATGATHPLFSTMGDLPDASANHGMFAHVHAEGAAYFAHGGQWVELAKSSDLANLDLSSIQSQIDAILGSSPETLDTLQEIVAAFESADGDLQTLMTANSSTISDLDAFVGYSSLSVNLFGDPEDLPMSAVSGDHSEVFAGSGTGPYTRTQNGRTTTINITEDGFILNPGANSGYIFTAEIPVLLPFESTIQMSYDVSVTGSPVTSLQASIRHLGDVNNMISDSSVSISGNTLINQSITTSAQDTIDAKQLHGDQITGIPATMLIFNGDNVNAADYQFSNMFLGDSNGVSLETSASTVVGAINELHAEMADNSATSTAVQAETDARVAAVSAEESARIAGDTANASAIVDETNSRYAADTTETQARISADNALDAKITAEESSRLAVVQNLQLQVNAVSQSIADADNIVRTEFVEADSDLQSQITALQASDAARQATGATSDEVVAVQDAIDSAETSLQSQIDNIVGSSPETLDTLQEIVAAYEGADGDLQTLISGNSSTLSTLSADVESAENSVEELTTDVHGPVLNYYPFSNNWQEYYRSGEGYQDITEYDNGNRVRFYNAVNGGYTGYQYISGLEPNTVYSFSAIIESASQDSRTVSNNGNSAFLYIGIQGDGTTYDSNQWYTGIHTTNGQSAVSQTYPKYANLNFTTDGNGSASIRVRFDNRWAQAIIKDFSVVEQSNPSARELLETTAQQLVPAVNEVRSSLLSKEIALQSQITVNANAIVAVDADRSAFETSVNTDRQSHRDEVQAQIDQVNADRQAFENSVNAGRDSHEAETLSLAAAFRDSVETDVTLLRDVFEGHVADINQTASDISQRHGSGVLDFPNEATSITYDKEVLDQYYAAKVSNDEFYFYNSSNFDYSTNNTNVLDTGIRVPFPAGVSGFNDHVILTREYFIAATSGTSGSFYVYDLVNISASSTPLVVVPHDGFCFNITHDGKDDRFFARKNGYSSGGSSVRAWDLPSIVSDTPVYLEVNLDDVPEGHDVVGFADNGIASNTNHLFVSTTANTIAVFNRSDLSFVTCIVNGDTSGSGSNYFGKYIQASDTMLVSSGWQGYEGNSNGNDYSGGGTSNIWVYDASDFNNFVKVNGDLSNDDTAKRPGWRMSSISRFWTNRQIAVNNDLVFVKVWGRWEFTSGGVVGLRKEDIFNGTWYNNLVFQVTQSQIAYSPRNDSFNSNEDHEFGRTLHITADKLLIEHGDAQFKGSDDDGNLLYIYDLTVTPDATTNRIDLNAQYPQVLEESNDGQWGYPQLSSTGSLTVSVTETFTPNESLTSAINYIHNKNQELETSVSAITGNSTFLSDLQAVESNVDFKLLAQDQRYDSDKAEQIALYDSANAEQTAIYAAANAEQSSIYDSANAAHVAYFEQYTTGETAARELADTTLQSQITSNDGDIVNLQSQIDTIVGTSPETLDTLQEIVTYFDNADNTLQGVVTSNETKVNSLLASLDEMGVDSKGIFGDDVATAADASHGDIFFDRSTGKIYKGVVTDAAAGSEILSSGHGTWMGTSHQSYNTQVWLDFNNRRISDSQPNYNTFTYTFAEPIDIAAMNFTDPNQYLVDITSVTYEDGTVESLGVRDYVRPADETRKISSVFLTCVNPSHKTYGWSYFNGITVSTFAWEELTVEMLGHVLLANAGDDQVREELMVNISALENYTEIDGTLETSSQTITGAINELNTSVQSITGSDTQFLDDIAANQTNIAGHDSDFVEVRERLVDIEDTSVPNLQTQIDVHSGQIATEVSDRAAGDAALQSQIDNIVGTSPETLDTLQEVVSTFQNADNDLQALITGNTSIVSTHTSQIATLDNQIHAGAGLTVPNMPTEVSRWVYQDQYIVTTSNSTDEVPVGHALVFDANAPLSPPTVLSPEGFGNHSGSVGNMSTPTSAKIIRDKVVVGYPYSDVGNITNSGEVFVWDLNDLSADPVVLSRYGSGLSDIDYFGSSVTGSADHNYIIVGEHGQDWTGRDYNNVSFRENSGRVYLYDINNLTNDPVILDPTGIPSFWRSEGSYQYTDLQFGNQVNVDGDYLYVTVAGHNYYGGNAYSSFILVFDLRNIQESPSTLMPARTTYSDDQDSSYFGWHSNGVAFNDNYVAVGSYLGPNVNFDGLTYRHGTVYVWAKNTDGHAEGEGTHVYALQSPDSQQNDYFGRSIAMDDTRLYVGAWGWEGVQGNNVGKVDVFDLSDGSHIQTIYAYDGNANDYFGYNLSVNGGKLVVSSHGGDDNTPNSGSLYIYDTSALSGIPIKVSESFVGIDTHYLGSYDLGLTVASGAVEIKEVIIPNASLSDGINYLEGKTEELKVQVQNINNSGALAAMSNSNRLDVVETEMDLLESADSAEQAARIAGDAGLQSQIDNLTVAASGDVSVESAARIAGDSDEAALRVAGDATVQASVDAEVVRATGVESGLQSQLDAIVGTSPETLDTLQEVVAAFEGADGDLQTLMSANASSISDLDTFVKGDGTSHFYVPDETYWTVNTNGSISAEGTLFMLANPPSNSTFGGAIVNSVAVKSSELLTVGEEYTVSFSGGKAIGVTNAVWKIIVHGGNLTSSSSIIEEYEFTSYDDHSFTFTSPDDRVYISITTPSGDEPQRAAWVRNLDITSPSSLDTTATQVIPAINEVHAELDAEVLRAQTAEGAEEVRALAAESVLQSNINTESSSRSAGDASLQSQIDTLSGTQTSDKSGLEVSIANETARATGAENTLQSNIDAEELRAQTAEGVNAAAVVTEKVRAEAVEAGLAADIAVETARATSAEVQLANHLGANFTDGSITVDGLATFNGGLYFGDGTGTIGFNSSVDHLQVLSDLDMMDNSVINVAAPVDSADAANKAYVDATTQTVSDRVDAILNGAGESLDTIVEVVAAFENADSDIQSLITSNSSSVTANTNAINAEVTARQQAITDEATARRNADSDLSAGLSTELSRALSAEGVLTSDLAAEVARATSAETGLAADIAAETSRATAAEGVNAQAIADETTRATTVEASLAQDIADEALRAQGAEAVLTSDVSANATAISGLQSQVAGVSTSSGSSNIEMSAEVDMSGNKITDMADPTAAQDAATKSYVDATVATEATSRTTEDTSLQSNIDAANARIDAILNGSVESLDTVVEVVSAFEGADSNIQNLITANASTISQNATAIATEATDRANADSDETALRVAGDAVLTADLATEVARATAAESAETSARVAADSDLQTQIDFIKENTDPAALDSLTELVSAFQDADSDVTTMVASNASAIAATNARTAGISVDSDSNVALSVGIEMGQNNIKDVNDVYAARGFIDHIESNDLKVQTGTVDFEGSIVNFGSSTITGGGFGNATKAEIDQHLNVSAADSGEFLKWNGTDYEFTDYIQGRIASNQILVEGTLKVEQPGSTIDWQDGLVHFGGSQVIVDEPTAPNLAANKRYVDEADSDLNALLSTAISNEESRATTAEGVLTTNLANEISRATSAESSLASDIVAEMSRATIAENSEVSARIAADSDLQSAIDAEVARATAAESVNAQSVVDEGTARTTADNTLQSNIDTVSGRVDAILNGSSESLDTIVEVVAAFENADSDLQTLISSNAGSHTANAAAITAEEIRALAAEGVLQSAVDAEETRATGVETDLQSQITSEVAARSAADQSMKEGLDSDIAAEAALRVAGDASLQSGLDVEVARATAAEGVLQSLLDSEQSARILSDQGLQSAITAEENARIAADAVLQSAIDAEELARTSADNTLQSNIDAVDAAVTAITNGSPETLNQLIEVVAAFEDADSDLQTVISNLGGDASALTARVSTLESEMDSTELATTSNANAISAETAARVSAVQVNADAITAESTARAAAITAEQNARAAAIVASESDRDSADAELQSQIDALSAEETAGKSSLQFQLTQEELARIAGDSDLTDSLAAEVARATAAESGLSSDIVAETSARVSADASLQSQIDFIVSNTDSASLDSLTEIVAEFQSVDGTLTGLISSNGSRITSLESNVGTINSWTTDNLSEGSINKYWTEQRTKDCLSGGLCIDYNSTTGEIAIDEVEAAATLTVAESHDANALGGQAPSHYRINVYDAAGNLVN